MGEIGAQHHKITPLWPQANLEAENFMKPLMKTICAAHTEKKDWEELTSGGRSSYGSSDRERLNKNLPQLTFIPRPSHCSLRVCQCLP